MSIKDIVLNANQLTRTYFQKIIYIYLMISLIQLTVNWIPNQIIAIFCGIFLATITHAYVVTSFKMIEKEVGDISFKDSFVGLRHFVRLFPSYIMRKIFLNITSLAILLPAILLIRFRSGFAIGEFLDWLRMVVVTGVNDFAGISIVYDYLTSAAMVVSLAISTVVSTILSYGLAMVPYLVEKYEISWYEAMRKSWTMMKGYKRQFLWLRLSYLPRMLLVLLAINLASVFSYVIAIVLMIYLPLILYLPQMEVASALFYKELISFEKQKDLFAL